MPPLSPRLAAVARYVRRSHALIDVGTDHGYLPASLILDGVIERAAACDIGVGPLRNAEKTAEKYGIRDKLKLVLADGLDGVSPSDGSDISIAGMGGELIVSILSKCEWIYSPDIRLILQPMTHAEDVRRFLYSNGFYIIEESAVLDSGKYYTVICSEYAPGKETDELHIQFGFLPDGEAADAVREKQRNKLINKLSGARAVSDGDKIRYYTDLLNQYDKIYNP